MEVVRLSVEDDRWARLAAEHPSASIFHTSLWINILADCYGYVPLVLAVQDSSERLRSGLPVMDVRSPITGRRWIALPFSDHVPLLSRDTESANFLLNHLVISCRERHIPRLELRGPTLSDPMAHQDFGQVLHLLELPEAATLIWPKLRRSVRKAIRAARRKEVRIVMENSAAALDVYYKLHVRTHRRLGVPTQPKRFFNLLGQRVIEPGHGFMLLAYVENDPVAGAVFLLHGHRIVHKYTGSIPRGWPYRPNHLLAWTAIEWACEHGFREYDWGKSAANDEGLRAFKSSWSATETPLVYTTLSLTPVQPRSRLVQQLMAFVIRRTPPGVGRLAGEMLYGHFA